MSTHNEQQAAMLQAAGDIAQDQVTWSKDRPTTPGAYWVRGWNLDKGKQQEPALTTVALIDGEMCSDLNECNTERCREWSPLEHHSADFEWLGPLYAALRAAPEWRPIESAPEGRLVVVGWLDAEDSHYPKNYEFDYLEDGIWAKHEDCVEHAHAVAPPGSKMPKEHPPYRWWMDLPAFPAARPQGVE